MIVFKSEREMVRLISSEGFELAVDRKIIERSILIRTLLEDIGESESPIPLPNVSGPILSKVIEYCTHHQHDPLTPTTHALDDDTRSRTEESMSEWDEQFCRVDQGTLFEMILAANYLDIKSMLDLTCRAVANMIKNKSPEEIRQTFNIVNDFTPEEAEQAKRENAWIEEDD
jgi:S-phase kinase-associated protein 1